MEEDMEKEGKHTVMKSHLIKIQVEEEWSQCCREGTTVSRDWWLYFS